MKKLNLKSIDKIIDENQSFEIKGRYKGYQEDQFMNRKEKRKLAKKNNKKWK